jgi:hypothetical protein
MVTIKYSDLRDAFDFVSFGAPSGGPQAFEGQHIADLQRDIFGLTLSQTNR